MCMRRSTSGGGGREDPACGTFVPFGEVKDVKTPLDQAMQKHLSFGFVTFLEREDAATVMDNMEGAELFGRVLTENYTFPEKINGGEQGWAAQPSMSGVLCFSSVQLRYDLLSCLPAWLLHSRIWAAKCFSYLV
ncbi:unnamed protein product [Triticum aestivum]|uniref:RRM domain-containing protein n=1 Tax=Triticum aestivum TaxID=4565 RepID=A0A7H4LB71_WHEAT|nr:unnamed protein product [Triticum aestivum]